MANVDLGHFVAAGGDPIAFIKKFNGRISSVHLKDRTTPANGQRNLPWGTGNTPLKEILLTMKRDKHTYPAAIELEYDRAGGIRRGQGDCQVTAIRKVTFFGEEPLLAHPGQPVIGGPARRRLNRTAIWGFI